MLYSFLSRFAFRIFRFFFIALFSTYLITQGIDRFYGQSLSDALTHLSNDVTFNDNPIEQRAQSLTYQLAQQLDIPVLKTLGFSMHQGLHQDHLLARFNPTSWRISFDPKMNTLRPDHVDHIILHELAHVIALLTQSQTLYGSHLQTQQYLKNSYLAHQIFHEAYADIFSILWHIRLNPTAQYPWHKLAQALQNPPLRSSIAHDTFLALRLTLPKAQSLSSAPVNDFLSQIHILASQSTVLTIAHQRLERETGCAFGLRGIAKFARDFGYASPTLPWEMAPDSPAQPQEPFYQAILELQMLRHLTPEHNPWRLALERTRPAVEQAIQNALLYDITPSNAGHNAVLYLQNSYTDVLSDEAFAAHFATKQLAFYRQSKTRDFIYQTLLNTSEWLNLPKTQGCID